MVNIEALTSLWNGAIQFRGFASAPQANAANIGRVTLRTGMTVTICNPAWQLMVSTSAIAVQCAAPLATSQKFQ